MPQEQEHQLTRSRVDVLLVLYLIREPFRGLLKEEGDQVFISTFGAGSIHARDIFSTGCARSTLGLHSEKTLVHRNFLL